MGVNKKIFVSDVVGQIVMSDHDLVAASEVLKELMVSDHPEGMTWVEVCISVTLLHDMTVAYIESKKSSK